MELADLKKPNFIGCVGFGSLDPRKKQHYFLRVIHILFLKS